MFVILFFVLLSCFAMSGLVPHWTGLFRSRHVPIPSKVDTGDPWILIVIRYQHSVEPFHEALAVPNRYNPFGFFSNFFIRVTTSESVMSVSRGCI